MNTILRGVVVGAESRALVRPGRALHPAAAGDPVAPPRAAMLVSPLADSEQQHGGDWRTSQEEARKQGYADGLRDAHARSRENGFAVGHQEGSRAARHDAECVQAVARNLADEQVHRARQLLTSIERALKECLHAAEEEMLAVCFEAVAAVFGELVVSEEGVRALVHHALAESKKLSVSSVHLHPHDVALIANDVESWPGTAADRAVKVVADRDVALGGCIVVTGCGSLDARIETQLARLGEVLRLARHEGNHA